MTERHTCDRTIDGPCDCDKCCRRGGPVEGCSDECDQNCCNVCESCWRKQEISLHEDDDLDFEDDDDFGDDLGIDCHLDRNGYCGKAGSEECEFECPYNKYCKS